MTNEKEEIEENTETRFDEVAIGQLFVAYGRVWIRTDTNVAIRLTDRCACSFESSETVKSIDDPRPIEDFIKSNLL